MARRRVTGDQELPFVALMDTMTNVVGVLVIVLVMVGLSITNTVKQILSDLPPVTVEQLQELVADHSRWVDHGKTFSIHGDGGRRYSQRPERRASNLPTW